jgi:ABC-type glycerol-3-phosphate transport system permease component
LIPAASIYLIQKLKKAFYISMVTRALKLTGRTSFTLPAVANSYIKAMGVAWGEMMATGVLIAVPMVVFGFVISKNQITRHYFGAYSQK